jgi:hypothetical protein
MVTIIKGGNQAVHDAASINNILHSPNRDKV